MRCGGTALLITAALLAACERSADEERQPREAPQPRATLIGTWTTDMPANFSGEGLRTRMSDGRTRYGADNRFDYQGRLTIFGPEIPPDGLTFRVAGTGDWRSGDNRLREDFTEVRVTSETDDAELNRLAGQMAIEIRDQPASTSRILSLDAQRLELRDEASGRTSTYTRTGR